VGCPLPPQALTRDGLVTALSDILEEVFCKKPFKLVRSPRVAGSLVFARSL
jgi:hypothetical protein